MNKEEILYNEIYERTKDFGRTHFIKEIMRLQRELEQLKEIEKEHQRINGELRVENQKLKDNWNKLKEIIKKKFVAQGGFTSYEWNDLLNELLDKMQEIELKGDKE